MPQLAQTHFMLAAPFLDDLSIFYHSCVRITLEEC